MERHPDDQAQQDDCGGDLNPNNAAQLPQHDLEPRAPRLGHLICDRLYRMGHEPQPIPNNVSKVEAVAAALLVNGQLNGAEIAAILSGHPHALQRTRWMALEANAKRFTASHGELRVL
jgi:hypothetical protein